MVSSKSVLTTPVCGSLWFQYSLTSDGRFPELRIDCDSGSSNLNGTIIDNEIEYPGGLPVLEKDARTLLGLTKLAAEAGDLPAAQLACGLAGMAAWLRHDTDEELVASRLHCQLMLYRGGYEEFNPVKFANAWKDVAELIG